MSISYFKIKQNQPLFATSDPYENLQWFAERETGYETFASDRNIRWYDMINLTPVFPLRF